MNCPSGCGELMIRKIVRICKHFSACAVLNDACANEIIRDNV